MTEGDTWRGVIAALANADTRHVLARLMLGDGLDAATADLSASRCRRITAALVGIGFVDPNSQEFNPHVFRDLLERDPVPKREGLSRFLQGGRIRQYPANLAERGELLAWVARAAFGEGEILAEREVNERLMKYSDDVAVLRRYLVDYQLVERRSDGSEYVLTGSGPVVTVD